jgi:hypothetical protein
MQPDNKALEAKEAKMTDTIIDGFFAALRSSGAEAALKLVAPDATFEAQGPPTVPIYRRLKGTMAFAASLPPCGNCSSPSGSRSANPLRAATSRSLTATCSTACGGLGRCSVRSGPSTVRCVTAASVLTRCSRTPPHSPPLTADRRLMEGAEARKHLNQKITPLIWQLPRALSF